MNNGRSASGWSVAFIGSAGIPNRYGGFEAFLEHCAPVMVSEDVTVTVTCDASLYEDRQTDYHGVKRLFLGVRANGSASVVHDLLAFSRVCLTSTHIVVLGVSGGPWFPLWRLVCSLLGKRLLVNIDGVEWRRGKFSRGRRAVLRIFDAVAQYCAHVIVYDNAALAPFVLPSCRYKSVEIAYSGDHVLRNSQVPVVRGTLLTICRIEPENNIEMLIEGALKSRMDRYTIIGNWGGSEFGRQLRVRYQGQARLEMLDPIYDPAKLANLRESSAVYLHGHSVGGTNPSLVEMLFYDNSLLCYDCAFNRETVADCARYFSDSDQLTVLLDRELVYGEPLNNSRVIRREFFTRQAIVAKYLAILS